MSDRKEELADLKNIVDQLIDHYGREEIEYLQHRKQLRTLERIEVNYYE